MQSFTTKNLIFNEKLFAVFYKPAGLNFHCENEEKGFVVLAKELLKTDELYSVHRLDKMTSGLIILAKSAQVANIFAKMFQNREIQKYYLAISLRKPKKKQGWIKADMMAARRGGYRLLPSKNNPAITQFASESIRPHERLFIIKPHTGKTHQIRVALKSIASAIAGDIRYADANEAKKEQRGYLHAYALRFCLNEVNYSFIEAPREGERFLSKEFCNLLEEKYKHVWELF
ncbi:pseudouridine synthase [Sulfurimonas sp.]